MHLTARSPAQRRHTICGWKHVLLCVAVCCAGCGKSDPAQTVIDFWAIGSEGERVAVLIRDFEQQNPSLRVRLQQIPWTAAHEKLLTAFAGDATPDVCQLGNTWIPEFVALNALVPLDNRLTESGQIQPEDYFSGLWETNLVGERLYGIPWYGDTRVLFYHRDLLEQAGFNEPPTTWNEWLTAMRRIKRDASDWQTKRSAIDTRVRSAHVGAPDERYPILIPTNEWEQPTIFALQTGAEMLRDDGQYGNFQSPEFRRAFTFYTGLFAEGLAPRVSSTQVSNVWEEFARGYFAMYITGPWNVGEFRRRLPTEMQDKWATAVLPRPATSSFSASQAGGCGLVLFRRSKCPDEAWRLIEFLSEPAQQVRFYELTGNLPPRESSWREGRLMEDPPMRAFHDQLAHVEPLPRVPEWEQITTKIIQASQAVIAGRETVDQALANVDHAVDILLAKRRWMLARQVPASR